MKNRYSKFILVGVIFLGTLISLAAFGANSSALAASVSINNGDKVTNFPSVTLTIAPDAYTQMRFRNESDVASTTAWEPVATTKQWNLSAGTGVKSVSVQFKAANGVTTGYFSDTITFDPLIDISFNAASSTYPGSASFYNDVPAVTGQTISNAVAVYPLGSAHASKVVNVGTFDNGNGNTDIKIIRYNTNGTIDFQYFYDSNGFQDSGNGVAIDSLGRIVVVGTCSRSVGVTDTCLLRLDSTGALDTTFGSNGVIKSITNGKETGKAVAIQPLDGYIVVAGGRNLNGTDNARVLRFTQDGKELDPNFYDNGEIGFESGIANAVAIQPTGEIVVVGTHFNAVDDSSVWILRLKNDGWEDPTFNPDVLAPAVPGHLLIGGGTTAETKGLHSGNAVAIDSVTGKIVVVGTYNNASAWVLQVLPDGTMDTNFNYVGSVTFDGQFKTSGAGVAIQPIDHKIILAGTYDYGDGKSAVLVARINNTGTIDDTLLDTGFSYGSYDYTFGIDGKFVGKAIAIEPDGEIIVVGGGDASKFGAPAGSTSMLTLRLHEQNIHTLTVSTSGSGTGTVTDAQGVSAVDTVEYLPNTTVVLTATPSPGTDFRGWLVNNDANYCPGTGTCSVLLANDATTVQARFTLQRTLTVSVSGTGLVVSNPVSINCDALSGAGCSAIFAEGTPVSLSATGKTWYQSSALWGGACAGNIDTANTCALTMDTDLAASATYTNNQSVRIDGDANDYYSLNIAYGTLPNIVSLKTIRARNLQIEQGNVLLTKPITISFLGGKNSLFADNPVGYSTIVGSLKVRNGKFVPVNLKVK